MTKNKPRKLILEFTIILRDYGLNEQSIREDYPGISDEAINREYP